MKRAAFAAVRLENPEGPDSRWVRFKKALSRDKYLWIMLVLPLLYFLIFCYAPMAGLSMAFVDYNPTKGVFGSEFVGLRYFQQFFSNPSCIRVIWNTFYLSFLTLIWGFPAPIIIALLLNECYNMKFKKLIQTVSYMPNFISTVVIVGMLVNFFNPTTGVVNTFIKMAGGEPINFMGKMEWFRPLYVGSNMWQFAGWTSIIYLSALSAIDPTLYEAAKVDGASRLKILLKITLPQLVPTIIIMFILRMGSLMSIGFEKINLMYSPAIYDVSDVISTYVYRRGLLNAEFGFGTAVGLFNSVINTVLLLFFNFLSRKFSDTSLL